MARASKRIPAELPPMPSEAVLRLIASHQWDAADRQVMKELAEKKEKELRAARDKLLPPVNFGEWIATDRAILDLALRRRIALERYSAIQHQSLYEFLRLVEDDIAQRLSMMTAADALARGSRKYDELIQLKASVHKLVSDVAQHVTGLLRNSLDGLAGSENAHVAGLLEAIAEREGGTRLRLQTQQITVEAAMQAAMTRPMNGYLLQDWLTNLEPSMRDRIDATLRTSFIEGEALGVTKQRLRGVTQQSSRGLEALIRTSNSHVAAAVADANYSANADVVEGVEWVSVLDGRTTDICRARDGKVWPVNEGPRPPAHINCRSTTKVVLRGLKPAPRETYQEWLKRQPAAVQDSILGPARGKLFRDGKMTVDRFVDMKGKRIPLSDLKG